MSDSRRQLGQWGEQVAADRLQKKGLRILEQNWRCQRGEIDLVALDGEEIVFVEVKTRKGTGMGSPEEGLTPKKAEKLLELAQEYLAEQDLDPDWRIDLVALELDNRGKLVRFDHVENAVLGW